MKKIIITLLLTVSPLSFAADKAFVSSRTMSHTTANTLALAAMDACKKQGYQVAAAVVDRHGNLLSFIRDPLSGNHTIDVAIRKAYTSATFQSSTMTLQQGDFAGLRFADKVLIIGGGRPVNIGGHFYGAIGISGAPAKKVTGDIDDACAQAGIESVQELLEFAE